MPCKDRHSEYLRRRERGVIYRHHAPRECVKCGATYQPTGTTQKFCSVECRRRQPRECVGCGLPYVPGHTHSRFCSRRCYLENGCTRRYERVDGYVEVWVPPSTPGRRAHGRMLEHRYVMQEHLGRPLTDADVVHHINGDRGDNRIENLQLVAKFHGKGARYVCRCCGSEDVVPATLSIA